MRDIASEIQERTSERARERWMKQSKIWVCFFLKKITWNFELFVENWLHSAQWALRAATKQAKETVLLRRIKKAFVHTEVN